MGRGLASRLPRDQGSRKGLTVRARGFGSRRPGRERPPWEHRRVYVNIINAIG